MSKKIRLADILELSIPERIQLVQDIWDSIAELPESLELSEDQKREIDRRIDRLDREPSSGISWEDLRSSLGR